MRHFLILMKNAHDLFAHMIYIPTNVSQTLNEWLRLKPSSLPRRPMETPARS